MKTDIIEYFNYCVRENKLPHAFLIETNNNNYTKSEMLNLLLKNKLIDNIDSNNMNLITIIPDGKEIKTHQIISLQSTLSTKPIYHKYNFYLILEAEKMNKSSANKLLKFLEDPSSEIVGILISENISTILPTIKSRCQIFRNFEKIDIENLNEEIYLNFNELLIKNNYELELKFRKEYFNTDRENIIILIDRILENIKNTELNIKDIKKTIKQIEVLDNSLRLLKSNVNIELVLDKLFIELR